MDIRELERIEEEACVKFAFDWNTNQISIKGADAAINAVSARIAGCRDEVAELLKARSPAPVVERRLATNVPSLAVQRQNYDAWLASKVGYYRPTEEQKDAMFAALQEGDLVIPDFAHSFSVKRPNGLVVSVDRKGRIGKPSPYSPALE